MFPNKSANFSIKVFLTFSLLVLVGFYYAVTYYVHNPALSWCFINAPTVIGVPQVTYATIGYYQINSNVLVFIGIHFAVYFIAFLFVAVFLATIRTPK